MGNINARKIIRYIVIFCVGFVFASVWSLWVITRPPQYTLGHTPDMYYLAAEEVTISAPDGTALSAWYVPRVDDSDEAENGPSDRAVILLHGYPSEKSDMLAIGKFLADDFSLLFLDLRYFGDSEGSYTTLGIREPDDVRAAIDFLEERGNESVGIFGFSLGGAVALLTASEDERVRAVAAYAPYSDLRSLGYESYRHLWLLKYPLVELMNVWGRIYLGEWFMDHAPTKAAHDITVPVLLVHSKDDEQISFDHAKRLQQALEHNPDASYHFFEGAVHGLLPVGFGSDLREFFRSSL